MPISELQKQEETNRRDKQFKEYLLSEDYQAKLKQRLELNDAGNRLTKARSYIWHLCERPDNAAEGIKFFINNFAYTFSPKTDPKHLPFITFEFQDRAIEWMVDCIEGKKDGLIEKSREMGMTWLIFVAIPIWYWLFRDGINILVGSYKEMLVDDKCYTDDTEVLTKDGWKLFQDTDINKDLFATRNKNKEFEWQKATEKTYIDYDGLIYNLKSRTMDLMVSPNHRVLHSKFWSKNEKISKAKDIKDDKGICIPSCSNWKGKPIDNFILENTKSVDKDYGRGRKYTTKPNDGFEMNGDDFCAFMGMYIAEGCTVSRNKKYNATQSRICIAQQEKSKGYNPFKELLIRIFGKEPTIDKGKGWVIRNKKLYKYLSQFGYSYEKFIPEIIKNATPKQLEIFLYYYMLGDGCWTTSMPSMSTVSKRLADDLQEIIQKIGKSSSISTIGPKDNQGIGDRKFKSTRVSYTLRLRETEYQSVNISEKQYKGKLACVTVPNTILYVRRNGKPAWSGNTNDSIFGKIDYLLEGLPKWMLPKNYNPNKHRTKLKLINPATNNLISGDTMNPLFGRGSRKTMILFDELGFWDYAKDAWDGSDDSTNCRIANSTPHGYNYYAQLREDENMDVLSLLWKLHPLKDQQWYEFECARRPSEVVAQEIDISYSKSREGKVYPEWNEVNVIKGLFEYDDDLQLYIGWDFGKTDDTAIIWSQKDYKTDRLRIIDTYRNTGKNIDFYVPFVTGIIPSDKYTYTKDELEIIGAHKNWRKGTHFGDPAGRFVNAVSDETVISVLKNHGIVMNFKDKWKVFSARKSATKRIIMDGIDLQNNVRTKWFNTCMINSSYPKVKQEGLDVIRSEKPKHDDYSHYRSSFEYLALGLEDIKPVSMKPRDKFPKKERGITNRRNKMMGY